MASVLLGVVGANAALAAGWSQDQELNASDAHAFNWFGNAVSLSSDGSTALIGSYTAPGSNTGGFSTAGPGAAYVFIRSGSAWSQEQELIASDGANNDDFGWSVSLSEDGSTALIGAYGHNNTTGAAYVFTHGGGTWSLQQELTISSGLPDDAFGYSVSLSDDGGTALISDPDSNAEKGAAFVFTRSGSTWSQGQELTPSDGTIIDQFGRSVSLSGDGSTALIGANQPGESPAISPGPGAAYVFTRSGGTWSQDQELTASDGASNDWFGYAVALSEDGTTALIGAYQRNQARGAAYVFSRGASTWAQQQELTAPPTGAQAGGFGNAVSLSSNGSTALIGDFIANFSEGAAHVFTRIGNTWIQAQELTASDGMIGDDNEFGSSVSLSPDASTAMIGADYETHGDNTGAAHVFTQPILQSAVPETPSVPPLIIVGAIAIIGGGMSLARRRRAVL